MKRLIKCLVGLGVALVIAEPSFGCEANHGYTKTTQLIKESNLSAERKTTLMQVILGSKAHHDQYTAEGDFAKMREAVQELVQVRYELEQ